MAAFNWIIFNRICPNCGVDASMRAQCHVASSFDGQGIRFCNRTYRLQETMLWWPRDHIKWKEWELGGKSVDDSIQECCYAECMNCQANLYAIIGFRLISPASIVQVGLEKDWPSDFPK